MHLYFIQLTILIGFLVITIVIRQSKTLKELLIVRLIFFILLIMATGFNLFNHGLYNLNTMYIKLSIINGIFLLYLFVTLMNSLSSNYYKEILTTHIEQNKLYCFIDNEGVIKELSEIFAILLSSRKEDLIGKSFFDAVDKAWRFKKFNNAEVSNVSMRNYYADYDLRVKPGLSEMRHFSIVTKDNKSYNLSFIEKPIFENGKYQARLLIGDGAGNKTNFENEQELLVKRQELDVLKNKFISIIELSEECMFFKHLDKETLWANERLSDLLELKNQQMSLEDFNRLIHPEDVKTYKENIRQLTPNSPNYDMNYRIYFNGKYTFVREIGKKVFDNNFEQELLGYIKPLSINQFHKTNIGFLDNLQSEDELLNKVNKYYEQKIIFELITIQISNIEDINQRHGRATGNAFMAQYLSVLKQGLKTDETDMFRLSESKVAIILTNVSKMEVLDQLLKKEKGILELTIPLGAIEETVKANLGKALSKNAVSPLALIRTSEKALQLAMSPSYKQNYATDKEVM